ncbi:hypothetical protein KL915_000004 [Ogataea haglerorum]|nr:hypothetical protein KL915_000004 [Ogataea haglerorum]
MTSELDVDEILHRLTLKEMATLLSLSDFWHTAEVPRLGIPAIRLSDGPNGVRGTKFFRGVPAACLTSGTGMGATFNTDLLVEAGELMAEEARHKGAHVVLGPTCNMQRGPLGGRGFESFSEDPVLSGMAAASVIQGIQKSGIAATIKHFVCNDLEDERRSVNSIVSERALREIYLLPFQLAIKHANPRCLMTAYNKVNGEHASQSKGLLTDVLREEWGWDGLVMSDWFGVYSVKAAIDAGLDLECPGPPVVRKIDTLVHEVSSREVAITVVHDRVRRVLELVKHALKSGVPVDGKEDAENNTAETAAFARRLASEAVVLLKNEGKLLPLKPAAKVAVVGPNAKFARIFGGGSASMTPYYAVDIYSGVQSKVDYAVPYALGCSIEKNLLDLGKLSVYDGKQGVRCRIYKEPADCPQRTLIDEFHLDSTKLSLFDYKNAQLEGNLFFMDFEGELHAEEACEYEFGVCCLGTTLLFLNDELFIDDKTHQKLRKGGMGVCTVGDVRARHLEKGEVVRFRIEFGSAPTLRAGDADADGGGFMHVTAMKKEREDDLIARAREVAAAADCVVLCLGTSPDWESEGFDRTTMDLPGAQDRLVEEVLSVNRNVIVVNLSGTPVAMPWIDQVPAVVQGWFNGMESGNAIADVLFGDVNPSGKLSLSFPRRLEDNPAFLTFRSNKGEVVYGEDVFVGYRYYDKVGRPPLFAFGHGLSYTSFGLQNLAVSITQTTLVATVDVTNQGDIPGKEVVQLYVSPPETSEVERPKKELKGFRKVLVQPHATETVSIEVPLRYASSYFDAERHQWSVEKGEYMVLVGNSSASPLLSAKYELTKAEFWTGL